MSEKQTNKPNPVGGFIIIVVIIVALVMIFSGGGDKDNANNDTAKSGNSSQTISEDAAEEYCQDHALLSKYLDMDKVDVINAANYNMHYSEYGESDKDGNPIMVLQWNGKVNDESTLFICTISGKKGDIKLEQLSVGGTELYNVMEN